MATLEPRRNTGANTRLAPIRRPKRTFPGRRGGDTLSLTPTRTLQTSLLGKNQKTRKPCCFREATAVTDQGVSQHIAFRFFGLGFSGLPAGQELRTAGPGVQSGRCVSTMWQTQTLRHTGHLLCTHVFPLAAMLEIDREVEEEQRRVVGAHHQSNRIRRHLQLELACPLDLAPVRRLRCFVVRPPRSSWKIKMIKSSLSFC